MASGFIEIAKDKSFSIRYTGYDELLNLILEELKSLEKEETELYQLLQSKTPKEELPENLEMGWGFVDIEKDEPVARIIELWKCSDTDQDLFWKTVNSLENKFIDHQDDVDKRRLNYLQELKKLK